MDLSNPVIRLCAEGTRAEFERRIADAHALFQQAWEQSTNDYEACIAAHYLARHQERTEDALRWNLEALKCADSVDPEVVKESYPSLYLSLGRSYELLGKQIQAQKYYALAADLGVIHQPE